VQIVLRADAGFAIPDIYDWCEGNGVEYLIGLAQNSRLLDLIEPHLAAARAEMEQSGAKVRNLHETLYAADSWPHSRRVLMKAEVTEQGDNPRFVVTSLAAGDAEALYDLYARRGEMENRIKELKNDLQMDRTSCHRFVANQFRVLLHAAAFVLLSFMRKLLAGTRLANAQVGTLQRHLLKLGVLVKETCRRVWLSFASHCPVRDLWVLLLRRMRAAAT
jgi:DNA-directed RNA polymerase subunit N (RpoN/RPB10)